MLPLEFHALAKREQYRDYRAEREQDRLAGRQRTRAGHVAAMIRTLRLRFTRRAIVPLGMSMS